MLKALLYEEVKNKEDKKLLDMLSKEFGSVTGSPAGAIQEGNRELIKAELNYRSAKKMTKQAETMICLTRYIIGLTIILAILTILLVIKELL